MPLLNEHLIVVPKKTNQSSLVHKNVLPMPHLLFLECDMSG